MTSSVFLIYQLASQHCMDLNWNIFMIMVLIFTAHIYWPRNLLCTIVSCICDIRTNKWLGSAITTETTSYPTQVWMTCFTHQSTHTGQEHKDTTNLFLLYVKTYSVFVKYTKDHNVLQPSCQPHQYIHNDHEVLISRRLHFLPIAFPPTCFRLCLFCI